NPEKPTQTFGDVWVATYENPAGSGGATLNDGKEFKTSVDVAEGSAAPNLLGKFHDKTSIEVDRTGGQCDGNVYFAWARFTGGGAGDCGDFASACVSGYTFMRGGTQVRATADQQDKLHDYVYVLYDPSIPGTEVPSGTTYGSIVSEDLPAKYHQNVGSQSGIY